MRQKKKKVLLCSFQCTVGKSSHLRRTSITLSASPFTLIPDSPPYRFLFVVRRKGDRGGKVVQTREKGRIAAFKQGVRRGQKWPLCDGGGERGEEQWFPSGRECRERTADFFEGAQGDEQNKLFRGSWLRTCLLYCHHLLLTEAQRSWLSASFCCTHAQGPHAQTCLMWKLTTYSALVRWTEMAKGSNGWKVKATRRLTAWFTGRPSRPAWILNFSRPESRA